MRQDLPVGTVTFLFTDVEGSTILLQELGAERYAEALAEHRRVIREACRREGGVEVDTQGDAFFFVGDSSEDQRMPFATLVTSDAHDTASNLTRTRVFRLNIGIARETYDARFGPPPRRFPA